MPADASDPLSTVTAAAPDSANDRAGFVPPLSVTRPELLDDGSDRSFRKLIWGLLVVANRMQKFPEAFGRQLGISSAQYAVLIATAHLQAAAGVGIRRLADYMHLPAPHITTTVGKLVEAGLLAKRPNPEDGRGVLISVTEAGEAALERLAPYQQQVNDELFGQFDRAEFEAFAATIETFLGNSARAIDKVTELDNETASPREAAE